MPTFVDASVMVAILDKEDDVLVQAARLGEADDLITSPVAVWKAAIGVAKRRFEGLAPASKRVRELLAAVDVRVMAVREPEMRAAIEAYADYGKGRHDAALNMGDCFAYACAKTSNAKPFCKGDDDFTHTDLA